MVSTNQAGTETEYKSSYHRQVDLWPTKWLLNLYPMTLAASKAYLGACNDLNTPVKVKKHFAQQTSRLNT